MARKERIWDEEEAPTEELINKLCAILHRAHFYETAFKLCGISEAQALRWAQLGREYPDSIYGEFFRRVTKADAQAELALVQVLYTAAAGGDVSTAKWLLSQRWGSRWGKETKMPQVSTFESDLALKPGPVRDEDMEVKLEDLSVEQLQALQQVFKKDSSK
jgi:hypothetical protein